MESTPFSVKLITFLAAFSGVTAYSVIFAVLFACGFGLPIPEDVTLIAAGLLAGLGNISLTGAFIVCFAGVMIGDSCLFFMGRKLGYRAFTLPGIRIFLTEKRIQLAREKVLANSKFICFTARFLPGLRAVVFLTSGVMGVRPIVFFALDGIAALISVPIWILLGHWFGKKMSENTAAIDEALELAKEFQIYILIGLAIFIFAYFLIGKYRKSPKA